MSSTPRSILYDKIKKRIQKKRLFLGDDEMIMEDSSLPVSRYPVSERQQKRMLILNDISKKNKNDEITKLKRNIKGETCLHKACIKGDLHMVKKILQTGIDINVKDNAGWTPLHEACNRGFIDVVRYLLEKGANVNAPGGPNKDTPLHDASMNKHMKVVKLLLEYGADIELKNSLNISSKELLQDDGECQYLFIVEDDFMNPNLSATPKSENEHFLDQSSLLLTPQDIGLYENKEKTTNDKSQICSPGVSINEIRMDDIPEKLCHNSNKDESIINKENVDITNINSPIKQNNCTSNNIKDSFISPVENICSNSWLSNCSFETISYDKFYCSHLCILRALNLTKCKNLAPCALRNLHFVYCMVPTTKSITEVRNWINFRDDAVKTIRRLMDQSYDYYSSLELNKMVQK